MKKVRQNDMELADNEKATFEDAPIYTSERHPPS